MTDKVTSESNDESGPIAKTAIQSGQSTSDNAAEMQKSHESDAKAQDQQPAGAPEPVVNEHAEAATKAVEPANSVATGRFGNPMPEVPDLLARIAGRVAGDEGNQENQEVQAAFDMRQRLRSLREQADESRDDVQHKAEGPFSDVEAALMRLSQQVEDQEDLDADRSESSQDEMGVVAGSPEAPWNEDAAEKLTMHCEAAGLTAAAAPEENSDELLIGTPEQIGTEAPVNYVYLQPKASEAGQQWFAQRFDEMSKRLDAVTGDEPAETNAGLKSLMERFDALEVRISALLEQTTNEGADAVPGGSLHDIELCIAEIAGQLEATTAELARIEGIELQIAEVAKAIADQRGAETSLASPPFDMAALASLVADKVSAQPTSQMAGQPGDVSAGVGGIGELSATVKEFVRERRSEGEHANAVLDTMQQTIIRVLDRMEALEAGGLRQGAGMPSAPAQAATAAVAPSPASEGAPLGAASDPAKTSAQPAATATNEAESAESVSLDRLQRVMGQLNGTEAATASASKPASRPVAAAEGSADATRNRADFIKAARQAAAKASPPAESHPAEAVETDRAKFAAAARQAAANANKRMINDDTNADEIDATHDGFSLSSIGARLQSTLGGKKAGAKGNGRARLLVAALAIVAVGLGATKFMMSMSGEAAREQLQSSRVLQGSNRAGDRAAQEPVKVAAPAAQVRLPGAASFAQDVRPGTAVYGSDADSFVQPVSVAPVATKGPVSGGAGSVSRKALPSALVGPLSMRLAAANGDPSAEFQVAARFADGKGVKQDLEEALKWYRRSASRGFALSQYRLGTFYERGLSVAKDVQRARVWYQRAASLDNVKAMHNLAVLAAGSGAGKPDYVTAAKWFTAAAERGLGDSQFNLAILYRNGLGVPQDNAMAYKWFSRAATAGDKEALRRMKEVEDNLGSDKVAVLRAEMSRWSRKPTSKMANDPHYAGQAWQRKNS